MSNLKSPSVEIEASQIAAVIDWLNRNHADARSEPMSLAELLTLRRGDVLIMHEATMGESADGVERIYVPGTRAIFWDCEDIGGDEGLIATILIGPIEGDEAIVNCFSEIDPAGYPFRHGVRV